MLSEDVTVSRGGVVSVMASERRKHYAGPVIDTDVHHTWPSDDAVMQYLPQRWREYSDHATVGHAGRPAEPALPVTHSAPFLHPNGGGREDAIPHTNGGKPGSSYEMLKDQLLDPFGVRKALLTYSEGLFFTPNVRNPEFAAALCSAMNDYTIAEWLSRDERLAGSIIVPLQHTAAAIAEIHRLGDHPSMAQAITTTDSGGTGEPIGHPAFHPVLATLSEASLPLAIHVAGNLTTAGGHLNYYIEFHALVMQHAATQLVSLLANGAFERFPNLKVVLLEGGVAWLPTLLWQLDAEFEKSWRELPRMKRRPSEYVADHVRLSTQPLELSPKKEQLANLLSLGSVGENLLVFSTDYPHWDSDDPDYVARRLPKEWLSRVFYENACELYGWNSDWSPPGERA
jgi:uncharacterized protein